MVRTSEQITLTYRELRLACDNDDCGHTMLASLEIIRTIRPSLRPNPEVMLPLGNQNVRVRRPRHANDDTRIPANDEDPLRPAPEAMTMSETS